MWQIFDTASHPENCAPRIADLRATMEHEGVDGFLVPRTDAYRGEYVAPCDERLAWLSGFTGSAGSVAVLRERAGLFVDGRYRLQARQQSDMAVFDVIDWPETSVATWLAENMAGGEILAYDPWLHTPKEIEGLEKALIPKEVKLRPVPNLIDRVWADRPAVPLRTAFAYPDDLAGETSATKRSRLGEVLGEKGLTAAVLTMPESVAWLLNIRGGDLPRVPVVQAMAILRTNGHVDLFIAPEKTVDLNIEATFHPPERFGPMLDSLKGPVAIDPETVPIWVIQRLEAAQVTWQAEMDPCALPKACKTAAEITGARAAHKRDALAMIRFLAWLDNADKTQLTEIDVITVLEKFRRDDPALKDIAFDTICGSGPHGAIIHYRVTHASDRPLDGDRLLLVDSGGQYLDGTTDITRTIQIGPASENECRTYTRVLKGLIALSRARFPKGVTGGHLDALARAPLWAEGMDYDHGTGHGVGHYLSVHEGPQRIARTSTVPLEPGMIVSNEPGHYVEGQYGIRLENLMVVTAPEVLPQGDAGRALMGFETLTYVPFDRRLIVRDLLSLDEINWLNTYHCHVNDTFSGHLEGSTADWLSRATAPL